MLELKIYKHWKKSAFALVLLAGCNDIVFNLDNFVNENKTDFLFWFVLIFSIILFPFLIFNLFDKRELIVINKIGIWDRILIKKTIEWENIKSAFEIKNFIGSNIHLKLINGNEKGINLFLTNINAQELLLFINEMINTPIEKRDLKLQKFIEKLDLLKNEK